MKKVVFLVLLLSITAMMSSQSYYYNGEKIYLEENEELHYVVFSDTNKLENLHKNISIDTKYTGSNAVLKPKRYWNLVKIKDNSKSNILETKKKILDLPNVLHIQKVIGKENPIAVSELFYVKLKSENDYPKLEKFAKNKTCNIIGTVAYMPLWYILEVSKGMDVLDTANDFYETGLFDEIDPGFIFNFQKSCTTDPLFSSQWGLRNNSGIDINICDAWNITHGMLSVKVAIVDQGIDMNHRDFATNMLALSFDAISGSSPAKRYGDHGTQVAGIIGANQNSEFISGVSPSASLMSVSHDLKGTAFVSQELASAISWAWQNGASIINNSWGDQGATVNQLHSTLLENAIINAITQGRNGLGTIVTFASGNYAPTLDYPGNFDERILCIGAIDANGSRASFSAYGVKLDVVAPGHNILSTLPNNQTGYNSGTSFAAPHVAGVAALVLSVNPDLSAQEVRRIIESTAQKVGNYNYSYNSNRPNGTWNNEMGYGLVDAKAAVLKALNMSLSGPDMLCPGDGPFTYSVSNVPANATVTWTCSGGVSLTGGNTGTSCYAKGTTPGYAHIKAVVNINGTTVEFGKNLEIASKSGNPYLSYTSDDRYIYLTIHTPNIYGIRQFIWNATPIGSGGSSQSSTTGPAGDYWSIPKGSYNVECRIVTQCAHLIATTTIGGYRSAVYPNPVDNTLHIDIAEPQETENAATISSQQKVLSSLYELRLFNFQGNLVRNLRVTERQVSIDVSGLPEGNYFLHIIRAGSTEPEVHKVIISH